VRGDCAFGSECEDCALFVWPFPAPMRGIIARPFVCGVEGDCSDGDGILKEFFEDFLIVVGDEVGALAPAEVILVDTSLLQVSLLVCRYCRFSTRCEAPLANLPTGKFFICSMPNKLIVVF
jgi:hypothetical protein